MNSLAAPVNTVARRDLRYALARSVYVADCAGLDPDAAYARRIAAAAEMHSIDREYARNTTEETS